MQSSHCKQLSVATTKDKMRKDQLTLYKYSPRRSIDTPIIHGDESIRISGAKSGKKET